MEKNVFLSFVAGILLGLGGFAVYYNFQERCWECSGCVIEKVLSPGSEGTILGMIDRAESSIDVEVYTFTYQKIADALIRAHKRGVRVRVILEPTVDSAAQNSIFEYLRENGVEVVWASRKFSKTHSKLVIVDGKKALVGSINLSWHAVNENREVAVMIENCELVKEFQDVFNEDWEKTLSK
ncbi:MAG: phospholipase D-like domain-containing protein [Candidatus Micrarchaeia archaeon]